MTGAKKPHGRPITRQIKIAATPKRVARAIFAAAKPPDPSKQKPRKSAPPPVES